MLTLTQNFFVLIELITSIRSTKVDLSVSPGSFIDISTEDLKKDKKSIINDNLSVFKRLGRIANIHNFKLNNNSIKILVGVESITLYFDKDVNLSDQKLSISNKVRNLDGKVIGLKKVKTLIQKSKSKKKGIIFVSAHYGNWELGPIIINKLNLEPLSL